MGNRTFTFDNFSDSFELAIDEIDVWPELSVAVEYRWYPPEPDVGLFHNQLEIVDTTYYVNDTEYDNFDTFVAATYEQIADDIEGDQGDVEKIVREQLGEFHDQIWEDDASTPTGDTQ